MSLDVSLIKQYHITYDDGATLEARGEEVYSSNITHNLGEMADKAGIYEALWRPYKLKDDYDVPENNHEAEYEFESSNIVFASEIIPLLEGGLKDLKARPEYYEQFNSSNGWGLYKNFVPFVEEYLNACRENPNTIVKVDR